MKIKIKRRIAIAFGFLLASIGAVTADDGSIIPDTKPPIGPKIPAKNQLTFYVDNDELVIESSSRDLAEITLVDVDSGTVVFSYSSILYPEFRCDKTGLTGTFNLIVSYGGQTSSAIIIL